MDENNIIEFDPTAMDEGEEEFDGIIHMIGDDGEEVDFLCLDVVEYEGKDYAVMVQMIDGQPDESAVILEIVPGELPGDETFDAVEDETVLDAVFSIYQEHSMEGWDFELTEEEQAQLDATFGEQE